MSANEVLRFLAKQREGKKGIGPQTFNYYLGAIKSFCQWMIREGRVTESPIAHLQPLNARKDCRRQRRAFSIDELQRLLTTTAQKASARFGMTGSERSLLYRLAVETGLRASELRSLTRSSFDLDAECPTVTVAAAYSKHRREDVQPFRRETADVLGIYLRTKTPTTKAFNMPGSNHLIDGFRADLKDAGIAYQDDAGRYADFHALRHTFITNLTRGGVHPKTAQTLARHSTITLTMDRYSHTFRGDEAEALSVLPTLPTTTENVAKGTGTDEANVGNCLPSCLSDQSAFQCSSEQRDAVTTQPDRLTSQEPQVIENKHITCESRKLHAERPWSDSNRRQLTLADLQSAPLVHSGTRPG